MIRFSSTSAVSLPRLLGLLSMVLGGLLLLFTVYLFWNSIQARLVLQEAERQVQVQSDELAQRLARIQQALSEADVVEMAWQLLDGEAEQEALLGRLSAIGVRNVLNVVVAPE
ncbi:MAG: hypothetical protein AAGH65_02615, partial [Pseudomonadota bacterium]